MRTNLGLVLTTVVAGFLLGGGNASAATVCLTGGFGGTNYGPDASCSTSETEHSINLDELHNSTTGTGVVDGSTTVVDFSSSSHLDFASGNSTISPHGGGGSFSNLDVTVPGNTFDDLLFHLQFTKTGHGESLVENLTVTWGAGPGDHFTLYPTRH
jgi:hypothetical protein